MRILQIAVDESFDDLRSSNGAFALSGYAATPEKWHELIKRWKVGCDGFFRGAPFKSSGLANRDPAFQKQVTGFFYDIIAENAEFGFTVTVDQALHKEIFVDTKIPDWESIYYFLYFNVIMMLLRDKALTKGAQLEFVFDAGWESQVSEAQIDHFMATAPSELTSRLVKKPEFKTDEEFVPLQAADMKAWFSRKRYKEIFQGGDETPSFRNIRENLEALPGIHQTFTRDQLILFRSQLLHPNFLKPRVGR